MEVLRPVPNRYSSNKRFLYLGLYLNMIIRLIKVEINRRGCFLSLMSGMNSVIKTLTFDSKEMFQYVHIMSFYEYFQNTHTIHISIASCVVRRTSKHWYS